MKKLKLRNIVINGKEILTREQLKYVIGGSGPGEVLGDSCSQLLPCQPGLICASNNTCQYPWPDHGSGSGRGDGYTLPCGGLHIGWCGLDEQCIEDNDGVYSCVKI